MRLNKKGTIAGFIGLAGIALLIMMVSSAVGIQENNETLLKTQVSREVSIKTENTLRLLDKATSDAIYSSTSSVAECFETVFENSFLSKYGSVFGAMESENGLNCEFTNAEGIPEELLFTFTGAGKFFKIEGNLKCSLTIKGEKISKKIAFIFDKERRHEGSGDSAICIIKDQVSGLEEYRIT